MTRDEEARVIEALCALDPKDENQYTSDGQPRLDAVRMLAEVPNITRADIVRLQLQMQPTAEPETKPQAQAVSNGAQSEAEKLEQQMREIQATLDQAEAERHAAQRKADQIRAQLDSLTEKRASLNGRTSNMESIRAYIEASQQRRIEAAQKR